MATDPQMFIRVAASIEDLKTAMAQARQAVLDQTAATKAASEASVGWTGALNELGHSFVARIAEGLLLRDVMREFIGFGKEVLTAGEDIKKMAEQTSMSTDEIQRLGYIASQSNTSIQSLVGAVQNLQQRLGDDTTGAAAAMAKLSINTDAFNKLDAYAQMIQLSAGIQSIQDPTEQASIAAALFGKTWKEILPAIKSGMEEVGDQAPIMAEATVESLARIVEAQKKWKAEAIVGGGAIVEAIEGAGFAVGNFLSYFNPAHWGQFNSTLLAAAGALNDPDGLLGALSSVKPAAINAGDGVKDLTLKGIDLKRVTDDLALTQLKNNQALKEAAEAAKVAELQYAELQKVTDQYYKAVAAASHDSVGRQIEDSYLAADAQIAAMTKSKNYSIEAEMMIWKAAEQTANNIIQKTLESDPHTKEHYQLIADQARIAYDFALDHASSYSNAEIQLFAAAYRAAVQASNHWVAEATSDMAAAAGAAQTTAAAVLKIAEAEQKVADAAAKAHDAMMAMGNTLDVSHAARDPEIMALLKEGWSLANAEQIKLARYWHFNPQLFDDLGNPETSPSKGERVPGYLEGGPVPKTGPAMLHDGEYVVPKGGALVSAGGGTTNYITIHVTQPLGTPAAIASAVDEALMARARALGTRFPVGTA